MNMTAVELEAVQKQMFPMDIYKDKRVVVTGASGLLGLHIIERLMESGVSHVRAIVHERPMRMSWHDKLATKYADLREKMQCEKAFDGMDYAFLCAAQLVGSKVAVEDPARLVTDNLVMSARSLEAAARAKLDRALLVSSTTVYPDIPDVKEYDGHRDLPHNAYQGVGMMKRYIERLAEFYHDQYGLKVAIVRPVPFYGRHDNFNPETCHVIPALIKKAVEKQTPFEVWGSGFESRDFLHVKDVARGCLFAMGQDGIGPVNLGSGLNYKICDVAKLIAQSAGHFVDPVFNIEKPTTIRNRTVNTDKARNCLGFGPTVSLEVGLKDTIQWYRSTHA